MKTGEPTVSYQKALVRVKAHAGARGLYASSIADIIWPKHRMKAQGSALAVGPFLRRMLDDGVIAMDFGGDGRGYRIKGVKAPGSTT